MKGQAESRWHLSVERQCFSMTVEREAGPGPRTGPCGIPHEVIRVRCNRGY